jgi:transcriptional regulator with XRE-family HTH domain
MHLAKNIQYLRKKKGLTQEQLAHKIGINRSAIGAYEENRAEPRLKVLQSLAFYFNVSLDALVNQTPETISDASHAANAPLRILPITIDRATDRELIPLVPVKAAAGYLNGYGDIDFIEQLPQFQMPFTELAAERSYRIFQTRGDSMLPVPHGAYVICRYIEDWKQIKNGRCYVLITQTEGVVYKRVYADGAGENSLTLLSDNREYSPYIVPLKEVREIWEAVGFTSFQLPRADEPVLNMQQLTTAFIELKQEITALKNKSVN